MKQERDPNLFKLLLPLDTKVTRQHLLTVADKGTPVILAAPHSGHIKRFSHQAKSPDTWALLSVTF